MKDKKTKILIVGAGRGGSALLDLFNEIVSVRVIGIVDKDPESPGIRQAGNLGVPASSDYMDFVGKTDIDEIINVTGLESVQEELIAAVDPGCEVIGGHGSKLFWDIIEEHKVLGKSLFEQKEFLRIVIDSLPHPFLVINVEDYTVKMANKTALKFGDLTASTKCYELISGRKTPCDQVEGMCPIREVMESGKTEMVRHIYMDENGKKRYVEVYCCPIRDEKGEVSQIVEYYIDVTDMTEAIREMKRKAKEMDIIYTATMEREGKILQLKDRIKELEKKVKRFGGNKK